VDQLAVALLFDHAAEAQVRAIRDRLVGAGLLPAPETPPIPPHITLGVCSGLQLQQLRPVVAELAAETRSLACTLSSVGAFPTAEGVIFLAPTVSHALLQVHEDVLDRMLSLGAEVDPYFRAGQWVPHCTLAIGLPRAHLAAAFSACVEAFVPISVQLTQLVVVEIGSGPLGPVDTYPITGS
jgi:2'-5' RNA ligase